jgi:heterodisulfide reductase subunit B
MNTTDKTKYWYYPGCSVKGMNKAYDVSTRATAEALGVVLDELDDWNCCGASAYMSIHEKRAFVLCARNLALAEKDNRDLVTVCNGCYVVLSKANKYMAANPKLNADIQKALAAGGMSYNGGVKVRHFLDIVVNEIGEEPVRRRTTKPLSGLSVAAYYGCQIGRPFGEIDDPEDPQMMDTLIGWLGGRSVPFALKAKCCGGMMMTTQPKIGEDLTRKILSCAIDAGADCIITACPLCQINLEAFQDKISEKSGDECRIPVLYFTQLMATAFGLDEAAVALNDSLTPVGAMFAQKGI